MIAQKNLKSALIIFAVLFLLAQSTFAALPRYEIIDLGTLGGNMSRANSINNSGQIVGYAYNSSGYRRATLFDPTGNGNNLDLGTLGGYSSNASSVNDSGQIVGTADVNSNEHEATLFDPTGSENNIALGTLGGKWSYALSINDYGCIVGTAYIDFSYFSATLFDHTGNGNNVNLGTLGGDYSSARSINNSGQIVGEAKIDSFYDHATLFDSSGVGNNIDLGTLGGTTSVAYSINDAGQIVGWAFNASSDRLATLFDPTGNGNNIALGSLGYAWSRAKSINNKGQIVGSAHSKPGDELATLFDPTGNGNNIDLNTLIDPACGLTLTYAYSINDYGCIVGQCITDSGEEHAFLIIPVPMTIYVDGDATGANDGSSWTNAFNYLQDALAAAWSGDEIRVAQGIYKPDQGAGITPGDREATFQLVNGVILKGGYAGCGEHDPNTRDIEVYETVLSGDLNGNDIELDSHYDLIKDPCRAENNYSVVTGSGTDKTAVLDGFTITGGNANADHHSPRGDGGGMFNDSGGPALNNCTFTNNSARYGGGMNNYKSSPNLTNCTFSNNSARLAGGMFNCCQSNPTLTNCKFIRNSANQGGGMENDESTPTLINCSFRGNSALSTCAGMVNLSSAATLTNCIFIGNSASTFAGMFNANSNLTMTNCSFIGNAAERYSGGMYNLGSTLILSQCLFSGNLSSGSCGAILTRGSYHRQSHINLTNCTFVGNSGTDGNALAFDSHSSCSPSIIQITNSIIWDGENSIWNNDGSTILITYSDIQGGWSGESNINADPCFVDSGYWDSNGVWIKGDYHLLEDSPCIDAGDPNYIAGPNEADLDGKPRVIGGRIDMGAYEAQYPRVMYVDDDATGKNDGSSWADAFNYLQDALAVAWSGDEIRVAQGIYKPDQGTGITPGDREATFQLINGVTLKGGYAGACTPDPNARDIKQFETILSGDLNGDDVEVKDPCDLLTEPTRAENSYHVVTASETDANTILDGFTITGGNANVFNALHGVGGAIRNDNCSNLILNTCWFRDNSARYSGGGVLNYKSNAMLLNCTFSDNWGVGMSNDHSILALSNCIFTRNTGYYGGGVENVRSNLMLNNCIFSSNSAIGYGGGGLRDHGSSTAITNCTFTGNSAQGIHGHGGAIRFEDSSLSITNSTFSGNLAVKFGGGIFCPSPPLPSADFSAVSLGPGLAYSTFMINNCILWENSDSDGEDESAQLDVYIPPELNYSCIQGWTGSLGGVGNIGGDPLFIAPGYWDANGVWVDGDYHLLSDSPCIDAGDPNYMAGPNETDLDGNPRVIGDRIDMGAYEYGPPISVKIVPRTINLASRGNWITCYIRVPEQYNINEIDTNSILLQNEVKPVSLSVNEKQQVVAVKFAREDVQPILEVGEVKLIITGRLADGTIFEATDTIKVLNKSAGISPK